MNILSTIKHDLSLVILLVDGFKNKVITSSDVTVKLLNVCNTKPIRKNTGYFVFQNIQEKKLELIISGSRYLEEHIHVDLDSLDKNNPVLIVVLKPSTMYHIPNNTTVIKGIIKGEDGTVIYNAEVDVMLVENFSIKLMKEISSNSQNKKNITVYNSLNRMLDGRRFLIKSAVDGSEELLEIGEAIELTSVYQLKNEIHGEYPIGTPIIPIVSTRTVNDGTFFIPIKAFGRNREIELATLSIAIGETRNVSTVKFWYGKTNDLGTIIGQI